MPISHPPIRQLDYSASAFNVASLLLEIEADFGDTLGQTVRLEVIEGSLTADLNCPREGLRDALIQLLANARDALPSGGAISLSAATKHQGKAPHMIEL